MKLAKQLPRMRVGMWWMRGREQGCTRWRSRRPALVFNPPEGATLLCCIVTKGVLPRDYQSFYRRLPRRVIEKRLVTTSTALSDLPRRDDP